MSLSISVFRRHGLPLTLGMAAFTLAVAAPMATSEEDASSAGRSARSTGPDASDMAGAGDSRTMQMLLDLQSSRAPLEGGERARVVAPILASPAPAPKTAAPAVQAAPAPAPAQNPFARALEMGRPAITRELRGPTLASTSSADQSGRPGSAEAAAALRGERYGEVGSADAEQALRDKIGGKIPLPVALLRYIRENRSTVLMFSLVSLALLGWAGARATQKRR